MLKKKLLWLAHKIDVVSNRVSMHGSEVAEDIRSLLHDAQMVELGKNALDREAGLLAKIKTLTSEMFESRMGARLFFAETWLNNVYALLLQEFKDGGAYETIEECQRVALRQTVFMANRILVRDFSGKGFVSDHRSDSHFLAERLLWQGEKIKIADRVFVVGSDGSLAPEAGE